MPRYSVCKGGWVVVADGEKALILVNSGEKFSPRLSVHKKLERSVDPDTEQLSDRPGRLSDGPSPHRSSVEQTDLAFAYKKQFAEDLSDFLNQQASNNLITELVIVAPSLVLYTLRDQLSPKARSKVVGELGKDLTNHPIKKIEELVLE